jgi:hypothetical protein
MTPGRFRKRPVVEGGCVTPATRALGSSETTRSCCERPLDTSADKPDIFDVTYEEATDG